MMAEEVLITVTGRAGQVGAPPSEMQESAYTVRGKCSASGESFSIKYAEPAGQAAAEIACEMTIHPEKLILKRTGGLDSEMHFARGLRHRTSYRTEQGELVFFIETDSYRFEENEGVLRCLAHYRILAGSDPISENTVDIKVQGAARGE